MTLFGNRDPIGLPGLLEREKGVLSIGAAADACLELGEDSNE